MKKNLLVVVLVAAMLVLAGCMGDGGTDNGEENVNNSDVDQPQNKTNDDEGSQEKRDSNNSEGSNTENGDSDNSENGTDKTNTTTSPPGISPQDNTVNTDKFLNSYSKTLGSKSYTMKIDFRLNGSMGENVGYDLEATIQHNPDGSSLMELEYRTTNETLNLVLPSSLEMWTASNGQRYLRANTSNQTRYQVGSQGPFDIDQPTPKVSRLRTQLQSVRKVEKTSLNGETVWRIASDGTDNYGNFQVEIWVDKQGLMRKMEVTQINENGARVTGTITVTGIGDTLVEEPDWIKEAKNQAGIVV